MWGSRRSPDDSQVTCIACGQSVAREDAREYDKHGDRWSREDKEFEFLCKDCYRECCHQPRGGLEALLVESGAGERPREDFLTSFCALAGTAEDPDEQQS